MANRGGGGVRVRFRPGFAARNHPRARMLQCNTSSASHNGADTSTSDAVTKIDLHEATREQLVETAGLRPLVADAILKARDEHGGRIADIGALKDALGEVKGIGPATLDQLADVLKVGRRAVKHADEKPAEAAPPAAKAGEEEAGRATGEAAEATAPVAKVARRTAEETAAAPVLEAGVEAAADAATTGTKGARRSVAGRGRSPPPPRSGRPASRRRAGPWRGRPRSSRRSRAAAPKRPSGRRRGRPRSRWRWSAAAWRRPGGRRAAWPRRRRPRPRARARR